MDGTRAPVDSYDRLVRLPSGRRFGIAEYGDPDGWPVFAFHGAPASRIMFGVTDADAHRLGLRIIAIDRPGYGLSPIDYSATLTRRTDAFAELADALGLDRFSVLGVSGGGPYAVALAARLGSRIAAMALISPLGPVADLSHQARAADALNHNGTASDAADPHDPMKLGFAHRALFLDLAKHTWVLRVNAEIAIRTFRAAPHFFSHTFAHLLPPADREVVADPVISQNIIDMTLEATRHGIAGGIADLEIYSEPWQVDYTAITAMTKLWQGMDDLIVPVGASLHLGRMICGAVVERIPEAGHFWIYRHIGPVLSELREMIDAAHAQVSAPPLGSVGQPVGTAL